MAVAVNNVNNNNGVLDLGRGVAHSTDHQPLLSEDMLDPLRG